MPLRNSADRYGLVAKALHWTIALVIIGLIASGWYMVGLSYYDRWYPRLLDLHKAFGILALELGALKILWSLYSRPPPLSGLPRWERIAARSVHGMLYLLMLAVPVTGYAISTSAGDPVSVFGLYEVPALLPAWKGLERVATDLHYYLAYLTLALVVLHAAAALKHAFIDKDDTLRRMI